MTDTHPASHHLPTHLPSHVAVARTPLLTSRGVKQPDEEVCNTTEEKFLEQELMVEKVKSFLEIHQDCSDCSTLV